MLLRMAMSDERLSANHYFADFRHNVVWHKSGKRQFLIQKLSFTRIRTAEN